MEGANVSNAPAWQPSESLLLTPTAAPQQKTGQATISFAQAYGSGVVGSSPASSSSGHTGERRSSMSQLAEVFNEGQSKATIMDMLSQTATPTYATGYPQQYAVAPGYPAGVYMQPTAYGYGQPYVYGAPTAAPVAGQGAGGFSFSSTETKKDPFDFGDLSKLASNM